MVFVILYHARHIIDLIAVCILIFAMYSIVVIGILNNSKMIYKKY